MSIHPIELAHYHDPLLIRVTHEGQFQEVAVDPLEQTVFEVFVEEKRQEPVRIEIVNTKTGDVRRLYVD